MQKETTDTGRQDTTIDEELIDTLIAISVVAKRLAANLRKQNTEIGGNDNEQNEEAKTHCSDPLILIEE